jgi:hypothetical protein
MESLPMQWKRYTGPLSVVTGKFSFVRTSLLSRCSNRSSCPTEFAACFLRALCFALLIGTVAGAQAGTVVGLQHQPGDASRPWHWRMIIDHLPMIKEAGSVASDRF